MTGLNEWMQWYFAIYLLPGGVALLILLLSAVGGGMHHGHHGGAGHGHHALGHGHHGAAGHGHQGTAHHGTGHHAQHSPAQHSPAQHSPAQHSPAQHTQKSAPTASASPSLLSFFGLGRVPAPLVWGSALLGWGVFGFWGTQLWQSLLHFPSLFVLPSLATALAGAFLTEKVTVEAAARFLPRDETYAVSAVDLCGRTGTVVFPVNDTRGRVHVYDAHGTMHDLSARTAPGQEGIARGHAVLLADYDAVRNQMIVEEAL